MSSYIIEKLSVTEDPNDPGRVIAKSEGYCSNCFEYGSNRHARDSSRTIYTKTGKGGVAFYLNSVFDAHSFDGGTTKGLGMDCLPTLKRFKRIVRRGKKAGLEVPVIADPVGFSWFHVSEGEKPCPMNFLEREIRSAAKTRLAELEGRNESLMQPKDLSREGLSTWMKENGLLKIQALVTVDTRVGNKEETVRFHYWNNEAVWMMKRKRCRGYMWYPYGIIDFKLKKIVSRK